MTSTARQGYAAGTTDSGEWLTIAGSAHRRPVLHDTAAAAEDGLADLPSWLAERTVIRYVREVPHAGVTVTGLAYRITEPAA